jgi:hypothetical protein
VLNINLSVEGGQLARIADTSFGPGDDFRSVWHFFDLIPEGAAGRQPKYKYAGSITLRKNGPRHGTFIGVGHYVA